MSRMESRRCPRAAGPSTKNPCASGPRCARAEVIRRTASASGVRARSTSPQMPHIGLARRRAQLLVVGRVPVQFLGDEIGALVLRLVIGAHHHLGEQAHEQAEEADQGEHHREERQRRFDEVLLPGELEVHRPGRGEARAEDGEDPESAEDVDGLRCVAREELHHHEIEDHLERAAQAVLALARVARPVVDDHLRDASPLPARIDGDEAVHLAVELHVAQHFAPVGLERAAVIVQPDAADEADDPIGDPRRQLAAEFLVHPVLAPAAHHVAAGFQMREQLLDVGRVVLQVAVHWHDHVAPRVLDSAGHRRRLSEIETETDGPKRRFSGCVLRELREGAVLRPVVDADDLVRAAEAVEDGKELVEQRPDVRLLVVKRDYDGDFWARLGAARDEGLLHLSGGIARDLWHRQRNRMTRTARTPATRPVPGRVESARVEPLLLTFTGRDAPGITAALAQILAAASARLLDVEQVVVQGFLVLGFSVEFASADAEEQALKELLFAAQKRGLALDYTRRPGQAVEDRQLFAATAIGRPLGPEAIHAIARVLAEHGGNIERIHELSEGGLSSVEFAVSLPASADAAALKRALLAAAGQGSFDCALQKESLLRRSKRLVVMDMDSTLIGIEVIDELARSHGVFDAVSAITRRAMMGEMEYDQSLRERVALLAGLDARVLYDLAANLPLNEGAETLLRVLKRLGYKTAVISGGFSHAAEALRQRLGIDHASSNP